MKKVEKKKGEFPFTTLDTRRKQMFHLHHQALTPFSLLSPTSASISPFISLRSPPPFSSLCIPSLLTPHEALPAL